MDLPDDDHVMRHVPFKRLRRDSDGNILGILPQAFEIRPVDNGALSVNWVEHFATGDYETDVEASIDMLRSTRPNIKPRSICIFAIAVVKNVKENCKKHRANEVRILHQPSRENPSHSRIIRLPNNDPLIMESLARETFTDLRPNISPELDSPSSYDTDETDKQ